MRALTQLRCSGVWTKLYYLIGSLPYIKMVIFYDRCIYGKQQLFMANTQGINMITVNNLCSFVRDYKFTHKPFMFSVGLKWVDVQILAIPMIFFKWKNTKGLPWQTVHGLFPSHERECDLQWMLCIQASSIKLYNDYIRICRHCVWPFQIFTVL